MSKKELLDIPADIPVLFFNSGEEDREAYFSLLDSGIPFEFRSTSEEQTPLLLVGYQKFSGLQEIRKFISKHS